MDPGSGEPALRRRPGTWLLASAAIFVVVAIIVAAILANRSTSDFPAGSAEAVAQSYIQALFDGEDDAARALLIPEVQADCDRLIFGRLWYETAAFDDVVIDGDRAVITVVFDTYTQARLELEHRDAGWLIADGEWPFGRCF